MLFRGWEEAVERPCPDLALSLGIALGKVATFLGPNGTGKSTRTRMVHGLDRPIPGTALADGRPYGPVGH